MADEKIGEAAEATAAEGGAVALVPNAEAEIREQTEAPPIPVSESASTTGADSSYSSALRELVQRQQTEIDGLKRDIAALLERESRYSKSDHGHPHDASVQSLIDALGEIDREEQAPERRRWWQRKLGG